MSNKWLSGFGWRLIFWLAFALLFAAAVYAFAVLVAALSSGS